MFNKSMNFIRLIKKYFSNQSFQTWCLIRDMQVMKKIKKSQLKISKNIPARPKNTGTWDCEFHNINFAHMY